MRTSSSPSPSCSDAMCTSSLARASWKGPIAAVGSSVLVSRKPSRCERRDRFRLLEGQHHALHRVVLLPVGESSSRSAKYSSPSWRSESGCEGGAEVIDTVTGNSLFIKGDRVVILNSKGRLVSRMTNNRANTQQRLQSGKCKPIFDGE